MNYFCKASLSDHLLHLEFVVEGVLDALVRQNAPPGGEDVSFICGDLCGVEVLKKADDKLKVLGAFLFLLDIGMGLVEHPCVLITHVLLDG